MKEQIQAFIDEWAAVTSPSKVEIIDAADDGRLIAEALVAGELMPAGPGRYYCRSHPKDTARSEEHTVVATNNPADRGSYNNWQPADELFATLKERMRGSLAGKTMYVIPYLMAPPGSPLQDYAVGVELTDNRLVALNMIRMSRTSRELLDTAEMFVRGVHVTADLDQMGQTGADDKRLFVTFPEQRLIMHFGSAYGGNALLGKIAHGLRLASWDGWKSGRFLAEQFMLIGITELATGRRWHICGGFPSASGKTNLAMTLSPDALGNEYRVECYGDDIAWMWVGEDGRLYAINPENGIFGVAKDTNEDTNPTALASIGPESGALFTNVAYNEDTGEVWWEGRTPAPPADLTGWRDWRGRLIAERGANEQEDSWAHPNGRFTTALTNVPNLAADFDQPAGVPIDAIIFGGRVATREPLIRAIDDPVEGVYDGLTLGAETTFAAEGLSGQMRYDPMSMRPFLAYPEGPYARHWLDTLGRCARPPIFAHVNWFARAKDGSFLWPGYRDNLRALLWLLRYRDGEVTGEQTPVGVVPKPEELNLTGLDIPAERLRDLLAVDARLWQEEALRRREHLSAFADLPREIWEVHERLEGRLADQ